VDLSAQRSRQVSSEKINRELLVVGYGSLLSGYGLLAERRGGRSRLVARDAAPVVIDNARRGLAKPSSHGHYLAMDIEPLARDAPITARIAEPGASGLGAVLLTFDRELAPMIAAREEYAPDAFLNLLELADRAGVALGAYLLEIARATRFDLLAYRRALRERLGYTSPGYIFHPIEIANGPTAIVAIGSGFDGSGAPAVRSRRREFAIERLLTLGEALALERIEIDRAGQIGYFAECVLGGLSGICVADLIGSFDRGTAWGDELLTRLREAAADERERFQRACSLAPETFEARFGEAPHPSIAALLKLAGLG
jgi:hypothetical protein